jgi:RNA polymerase sigma factor (sigma-70 family)
MNRALYSDEMIVEGLRNKDHEKIRFLYRNYFDSIQRLILKNSGNTEDAEDIFQDALVIVYKKIQDNQLKLSCSLKTYMYAISRNLWLQKLQKKDNKSEELIDIPDENREPFEINEDFREHEKYNLYQKHFLKLSEDCQRVLKLFLKKISLKEITKIMKFSSVDYTKTRKYLCKKNLKERILNDPTCSKYVA